RSGRERLRGREESAIAGCRGPTGYKVVLMTEDEIEVRAQALAGLFKEYFTELEQKDPNFPNDDGATLARGKAYWLLFGDPSAPTDVVRVWNIEEQKEQLRAALQALRKAAVALDGLAGPVRKFIDKEARDRPGLLIPASVSELLEQRGVSLRCADSLQDAMLENCIEQIDPKSAPNGHRDFVTAKIATRVSPQSSQVRGLHKYLQDNQQRIEELIDTGGAPGRRDWEKAAYYRGLREFWEAQTGDPPPVHYARSERNTFFSFADRAFVALGFESGVEAIARAFYEKEVKPLRPES
ncbi:MAG: hypothetical protein AAFS03_09025, partial [Pseudomonadota bacterium]